MDVVQLWRAALAEQDVADALEVAEIMSAAPTEGLGAKLGAVVDLAFAALLGEPDPQANQDFVELMLPMTHRAAQDPDATPVAGRGVVAAAALLRCLIDDPMVEDPAELLAVWVPRALAGVATLTAEDRHDWALACVAQGLDEHTTGFTGGELPVFAPGDVFGPDKPSFARYLSAAALSRAGLGDVNPAWTSFVADFPAALEAGSVRWSCLMHAGYAVYTRFADHRPVQVLDAIRGFIRVGIEG